jgi:hypothetical protein
MSHRAQHASIMGVAALCLLTLPCRAGPCSDDIHRMEDRINAWLDKEAASRPPERQSIGAQDHRQPTPRSIAEAEGVPAARIAGVRNAMERARKADSAGDKAACDRALADVPPLLSQ